VVFGEFRQLTIEARRQVLADLADLLLDDVIIVEHPLGRRRDAAAFVHRAGDRAIRREQNLLVVSQARA
jgi:hypothetical protein